MSTRSLILSRAIELLAESPDGDISTRAVCEAAGVTQPVLYRQFGDKSGLLTAVADAVWDEYLEMKRAASPSEDPVADLRSGWDAHTGFALAHPHAYRLVFASGLDSPPAALAEAMALLQDALARIALRGRLRMDPSRAARIVMAANSGVALALILRPEEYRGTDASADAREATLRGILVDAPEDAQPVDGIAAAATAIRALLARSSEEPAPFSPAEAALLDDWLARLPGG
ncbi:TetR/AcrR family transcriptional regulator [Leucobacter allii]|uniref:TetR/AcrR family transcriptional regulator n=1 Tax=Leucobacter allii TaxID=2932247 RepID=A0ABY4FNM9_9MICO|nr:TetR/AcrR family transcriptional regulator [Leucobacter allii]UOQ57890.1 TetR/AcrR family transcriptional regulator [Leucobacter allii]